MTDAGLANWIATGLRRLSILSPAVVLVTEFGQSHISDRAALVIGGAFLVIALVTVLAILRQRSADQRLLWSGPGFLILGAVMLIDPLLPSAVRAVLLVSVWVGGIALVIWAGGRVPVWISRGFAFIIGGLMPILGLVKVANVSGNTALLLVADTISIVYLVATAVVGTLAMVWAIRRPVDDTTHAEER